MSTVSDSGISISDSTFQKSITSSGIYNHSTTDLFQRFNRFNTMDPYHRLPPTKEYVFFTKPDLHIFNGSSGNLNTEIENVPIFVDALRRYPGVLKQLQYSSDKTYPFINLLSNTRVSNLDLPGIHAESVETSANIYGTALSYRKESNKSDEQFDFSLDFDDTKNLEVYMFFKLFDEYERKKFYGSITPPDESYIINKILHDQISIFKFIVSDDAETLIFWAKLYGCYPITVPRDSFSELPAEGDLKLTTQWKCQFVEDMDPNILVDFNILTSNLGGSQLDTYDGDIQGVDCTWATAPYIVSETSTGYPQIRYKLRWKE